ncbi:MAG: hypothetical protein ACI9PX_000928 [Reinekea sp.]|jgi:hypothetical protein
MAAIILGKNLLSEEDLIEFAFSDSNVSQLNLVQLSHQANDASIHSSLLLIRMMKADRIYITSSIKMNQSGSRF